MKQKTISWVQPNFKQGPGGIASYLPYSVGILWSYCLTNDFIKENLVMDKLVYKREPIQELAIKLSKNDIIGFSTYVWNRNYNFKLAQRVKEINPNVFIFFGGPEPPITNPNIFSDIMPFADIVVRGEGEYIVENLIEKILKGEDYSENKGLLINQNGVCKDNGAGERINDLDSVPSPYITGVFDSILPLEKEWNAVIETNRGCPYKCTFCDWGSLTYSKVKKFNLTRVFHEIEWMSKNKIGYMDVADANFGIFVERDNLIVDKIIEVQTNNGYPYRTGWSWAKNQQSEVVQIAKKLIQSGHFNNGLTISLQSMDENTLETIKRTNMGINKINEIFAECRKDGVPLNVELILGLPGETLKTWYKTMFGVLEVGQHDSIEVWQAQILENAEMNLSQRKEYNIRGQKVLDYFPNGLDNEAPEVSEIVTETSTMSMDDMVEGYKLSWFLITWHTGGFSQYISRFIRKYKGENYEDFYSKFREFLSEDYFWKQQEMEMSKIIHDWYLNGNEIVSELGDITITAATNQYRSLFKIHYYELYQKMYSLVNEFLKSYNLPDEIYKELVELNQFVVAKQRDLKDYQIQTKYNILEYILDERVELKESNQMVQITYPHDPIRSKDLEWFMESLFFARRRSYGKNYLKVI
jgi:coproporphyrinogen III oxidase-like Fe-S oxidoreductase